MEAEDYLRQAAVCEEEARKQPAEAMRRQFEILARQWRDFAERIENVQTVQSRTSRSRTQRIS